MIAPDRLICRETERATLLAMTAQGRLVDLRVVRKGRRDLADRLYLGRLEQVHPDLKASFVAIGEDRSAFLRAEDLVGFVQWPQAGTPLLVQVRRDAGEDKGPRASMNVSITGRYLVYHPYGHGIGFSRRIQQEAERERLQATVAAAAEAIGGDGGGFVLRTAADSVDPEAIEQELPLLLSRWDAVRERVLAATPPLDLTELAMPDSHPLLRAIRDYGHALSEIVLDNRLLARRAQELVDQWQDDTEVRWHEDGNALLDIDDIMGQIETALSPRIVLQSGVEVLFEPGQTLCAIDVDSGSAGSRQGQGPRRAVDVNVEAAHAIADQLRLRNIGGVVLIDFVTMRSAYDRDKVVSELAQRFADDPVPAQVVGFTRLGLLEVTRARRGPSLVQLVEDIAGFEHVEPTGRPGTT
jgi:ribonuclease G